MKRLLGAPLFEVFCFFALVLEPGLLLGLLAFLALEVKLLVDVDVGVEDAGLGLLEVVLQHAPHSVEFLSLHGVKQVLVFLLLFPLPFLLDLLVQPFLLLVLEEFLAGVILCVNQDLLRSSPSNSRQPDSSLVPSRVGKSLK